MNTLQVFKNDEFGTVRTLILDGQPYFVGKDVADILGYTNSRNALAKRVDDEDKGVAKCDTLGGAQDLVVINESGLYSLILTSRLPSAKQFKRWVTAEVLPSIRKHGMYAVDDLIANPDLAIAALQALKAEREASRRLAERVAIQTQQIAEMQPKVSYFDLVLSCPDAQPITIIAEDYGWSANKMNKFLHEQGVQYKIRKTWVLYSNHAGQGYTKTETVPYTDQNGNVHNATHTKWTQKGRLFIYDLMKAAGNLPLVEQDD